MDLVRPLTDGSVLLRPPEPGEGVVLVAGRDQEWERFLGPGHDDPHPTACVVVDHEVVGWVDASTDQPWLRPGEVNIGYNIFPSHRSKGYATRAVRLLVGLLQSVGLSRAYLVIADENAPSLGVASSIGAQQTGPRADLGRPNRWFKIELQQALAQPGLTRVSEVRYRPAEANDFTFLATMLGEAAVWRPDKPTPTAEQVMADPRYSMYLAGWPRQGDYGLIAEQDGPVGAAWYRTYTETDHGHGFVAENVPELSIAVIASRRGEGIGLRLLGDLIGASVAQGFRALSLSVAENNPARRLYESVGFAPVEKHGHTYTMVRDASPPGDVTLATYQARANVYRDHEGPRPPALEAFLHRLASLVPGGRALEVGSGTGSDAGRLEELGLQVERTDATPAFVEMQREAGHRARLLDARSDELGGPFDAILSIAALHHLTRAELEGFLARARAVVPRGGVLAMTLKEGDGEAWSDAKLGQPRYFVYWREQDLRDLVTRAGWNTLSLDHIEGREPWLFLLARRDDVDDLAGSDT